MDTTRSAVLLAIPEPILFSKKFQGLGCLCRKDNSSQSSGGRLKLCSCCHVKDEASKRLRDQVQEYGPDSLSAVDAAPERVQITALLNNASTKP